MISQTLLSRITAKKSELMSGFSRPLNAEGTLDRQGLRHVKEDAFVKIAAKVQMYIDLSLKLRKMHPEFGGLPPTEVTADNTGNLVPAGTKTEAIDQQRQLYAAARSALLHPAYGDQIMEDLVEWHDAFLSHFVIDDGGPKIRAKVHVEAGDIRLDPPDPKANLRLTYALQGSATLVQALRSAAARQGNAQRARLFRDKAEEIASHSLAIGECFYREYVDISHPGRYFLYPHGASDISNLVGMSHNNSQSYLIEGMAALADLDAKTWQPRLLDLLAFIHTQRDDQTGLLHEFHFASAVQGFPADPVSRLEGAISWQAQEGHETVVFGHTLAGYFAWPAKLIAENPSRRHEMPLLLTAFVEVANRISGITENGLPANAFQLIPVGSAFIKAMPWPEGSWQAELLWQFLLHADRAGMDLNRYKVNAGANSLTLDRLLARSLDFHDGRLFDGVFYFKENQEKLERARVDAAPINHPADTLRDLASNLGS